MEKSILQLFPREYREIWQQVAKEQAFLQEIRIRAERPVMVYKSGKEYFLTKNGQLQPKAVNPYIIYSGDLEVILEHICHYSPYAYEEELRKGFVTVSGGHRVGVVGQVVLEADGKVRTIKNVSCLNIRISHQIIGVANVILPHVYRHGNLKNVLIISPPGCGKTTLLRDLIRQISDGNSFGEGLNVGVVDERSELAGSYMGKPQNDMGMRTDVLDGCSKEAGVLMLLRSMSPGVLALDEVGEPAEWDVLRRAGACGCRILATVHGESLGDVEHRFDMDRHKLEQMFDLFIILGKREGRCVVKEMVEGRG